jgi:hypothetical protein
MSVRHMVVIALVSVASLAVGVTVATASQFPTDPVTNIPPGWLSSTCVVNGVTYLSDDAFEDEGFGCDETPDNGSLTGICIDGVAYNYISDDFDNVQFVAKINAASDLEGKSYGHVAGVCTPPLQRGVAAPVPQGPDRYIFCAVAGNTDLNGNPIAPGASLNLPADQAASDPHYQGATPGFFVPGLGATCSLSPEQAALAAASTKHVNHTGGSGDYNQPELYTLVG